MIATCIAAMENGGAAGADVGACAGLVAANCAGSAVVVVAAAVCALIRLSACHPLDRRKRLKRRRSRSQRAYL